MSLFDTEYDRAKVPPYNGNDTPPAPGSPKTLLFPPLLNKVSQSHSNNARVYLIPPPLGKSLSGGGIQFSRGLLKWLQERPPKGPFLGPKNGMSQISHFGALWGVGGFTVGGRRVQAGSKWNWKHACVLVRSLANLKSSIHQSLLHTFARVPDIVPHISGELMGSLVKGFLLQKNLRRFCRLLAEVCVKSFHCVRKECGNSAESLRKVRGKL